jgi:phytoene desaturase
MLQQTPQTRPINPGFDERPHALVIGAGFGGLAAAVRLGARGYRVTVVERLDQPGGRAGIYSQDGFTFDQGPTIITLPQVFEELWALAGRKLSDDVDLRPLDPFYSLKFDDGSHFTCCGDEQLMMAEIARLSPKDAARYPAFRKKSEEIYRFAFEGLGQIPFSSFAPMITAVPGFALHRAEQSVWQLVSKYFTDERLRIAFSFHPLFIGGNPFDATGLYALVSYLEGRYGVHYAMGGTHSLVKGLVGLIERQGGTVRLNAGVKQILVENGAAAGVELDSGEKLYSAVVVSNADAATTYSKLLAPQHRHRWTDARLARARYSMSLVVWHFGTNRRYDDVEHHTILLGPRYKGLLKDIFKTKTVAEDFSLYLYRPSATDPSVAPEGCDSFYALMPVPNLDGDADWETLAEPFRARVQKRLEETLLPGLGQHIVTQKLVTPLDFRDRLQSYKGAAFSLEPVMFQSAWFRPHNRSEEVDNLYLVGAGTHPGAGVPSVVISAKILDQVVPHASTLA